MGELNENPFARFSDGESHVWCGFANGKLDLGCAYAHEVHRGGVRDAGRIDPDVDDRATLDASLSEGARVARNEALHRRRSLDWLQRGVPGCRRPTGCDVPEPLRPSQSRRVGRNVHLSTRGADQRCKTAQT